MVVWPKRPESGQNHLESTRCFVCAQELPPKITRNSLHVPAKGHGRLAKTAWVCPKSFGKGPFRYTKKAGRFVCTPKVTDSQFRTANPQNVRFSIREKKAHKHKRFALVNVQMVLGQTAGCPRVNRAKKFMCSPRNTRNINFSLWLTGGLSQGCPDFQKVYVFKVYVPFSCPILYRVGAESPRENFWVSLRIFSAVDAQTAVLASTAEAWVSAPDT